MHFDARVAARLPSGEPMSFEQLPGLRLQASARRKSWTYRYKSPIDGRMRQFKLGEWPAMAFPAAIAAWETNRVERDLGAELSEVRRKPEKAGIRSSPTDYSMRSLNSSASCRLTLRTGERHAMMNAGRSITGHFCITIRLNPLKTTTTFETLRQTLMGLIDSRVSTRLQGRVVIALLDVLHDMDFVRARARMPVDALFRGRLKVAKLVISSQTHKDIANTPALSPATVRNHLQEIHDRVGVKNSAELTEEFRQAGF
ncbi:LuxR C-terminal-related transcriptional regulator [Paraburkholderia sacchari]|uniref:LuxR C-terminal-related transcriptional regulator n=1 Tax=Paraburkholderia sacchari TaxID=159450 RepID=UPI001FD60C3A|nr:LuxR C-terminal-related transcriptional regulator [Paraburkholderia sacchari]